MTPEQIATLTETEKNQAVLTVLHGEGDWKLCANHKWWAKEWRHDKIIDYWVPLNGNPCPVTTPEGREQVEDKLRSLGYDVLLTLPQEKDLRYEGLLEASKIIIVVGSGTEKGRALVDALLGVT